VEFVEMLSRIGEVARHEVGLADVLVGSAVARIQRERPLVVLERRFQLPESAVGETKIVLQVSVVWVAP